MEQPGGYCAIPSCQGGQACPSGAVCDANFQDGGSFCLKSCQSNTDCRVSEGYECDQFGTCWPAQGGVPSGGSSPIGGPCASNTDCMDAGAQCFQENNGGEPTGFINGYCLISDCTANSCPAGSICETIFVGGGTACVDACQGTPECRNTEGYQCVSMAAGANAFCFRGCGQDSTCPAGYACGADAYCTPACTDEFCGPDMVCGDDGLCHDPPCTAGSCPAGLVCNTSTGNCGPDLGSTPGQGPGPTCPSLPERDCVGGEAYCGELTVFDPRVGDGYDDYPINGESASNQYRSYLRRDAIMLIKYAAAYVSCKAESWTGGNGHPLGMGDMSEANGTIPGTSDGSPGHPPNTHENGFDIDMAYFQTAGPNNYLRAVCDHTQGGQDMYHCVSAPYLLDVWRNALFIGVLGSSPRTRVIGVDGQVGALVTEAISTLCADGWFPHSNCNSAPLAYEVTDQGQGWYMFHHHHMHLSLNAPGSAFTPGTMPCLTSGCQNLQGSIENLKYSKRLGHTQNLELAPLKKRLFFMPLP